MDNYYFCGSEFKKHFSDKIIESSDIFKSGYNWDNENYYVVKLDNFDGIKEYYDDVIEPYNEKSKNPVEFWIYEVCDSHVDVEDFEMSYLPKIGLIRAIEDQLSLSKERNIAYAIYKLTEKYGAENPIEFINKINEKS